MWLSNLGRGVFGVVPYFLCDIKITGNQPMCKCIQAYVCCANI